MKLINLAFQQRRSVRQNSVWIALHPSHFSKYFTELFQFFEFNEGKKKEEEKRVDLLDLLF